jgi:very-short-patch-repair endonuclease
VRVFEKGKAMTDNNDAVYRDRATAVMVAIARTLRQCETPAEQILWEALRNRRLDGLKFRRQHPIAGTAYVADFLCYEHRLIIELDGDIHNFQQEQDSIRQANIEANDYIVLRFRNEQVTGALEQVLIEILRATDNQ